MRVHVFLELWGLINFNVQPYLKPHKISLVKESAYDRVLVNAANKNYLCKNEEEYLSNLFDAEHPQTKTFEVQKLDPYFLRRVNILTSRTRPFCAYCGALCGFLWFASSPSEQQRSFTLCESCFKKTNYPSSLTEQDFEQRSLPLDQWERLQKDLSEEHVQ
jgi:hypothetical protein